VLGFGLANCIVELTFVRCINLLYDDL